MALLFPDHASTKGEAIYTVEYTPLIKPTNKAKAKLLKTSPPKNRIAITVQSVTPEVSNVLAKV